MPDPGETISNALLGFAATLIDLRRAYDSMQFQREQWKAERAYRDELLKLQQQELALNERALGMREQAAAARPEASPLREAKEALELERLQYETQKAKAEVEQMPLRQATQEVELRLKEAGRGATPPDLLRIVERASAEIDTIQRTFDTEPFRVRAGQPPMSPEQKQRMRAELDRWTSIKTDAINRMAELLNIQPLVPGSSATELYARLAEAYKQGGMAAAEVVWNIQWQREKGTPAPPLPAHIKMRLQNERP